MDRHGIDPDSVDIEAVLDGAVPQWVIDLGWTEKQAEQQTQQGSEPPVNLRGGD